MRTVFPDTMIRLRFHDRAGALGRDDLASPSLPPSNGAAREDYGRHLEDLPARCNVRLTTLPPRAERDEIVRCVNALSALADMVERRRDAASSRCADATWSILATAFRGALVPGPSPRKASAR